MSQTPSVFVASHWPLATSHSPMPWTYPALMLLAIAVGVVISRRMQRSLPLSRNRAARDRPGGVLRGVYRSTAAVRAVELQRPNQRSRLVQRRQDDHDRNRRRLFRRRTGQVGTAHSREDGRFVCRARRGGGGDRPAGLLQRRLLLRHADVAPLGRRVPHRRRLGRGIRRNFTKRRSISRPPSCSICFGGAEPCAAN